MFNEDHVFILTLYIEIFFVYVFKVYASKPNLINFDIQ